MVNLIGLIPARAGSKRCPRKAVRMLGGIPVIAWTIRTALAAGIFTELAVCADDDEALAIGREYGLTTIQRSHSADDEADIAWVRRVLELRDVRAGAFAILRPTSPFRTSDMLQRAWEQLRTSEVHSLRAVEPATQHPGKMWWWNGAGYPMTPVCDAKRSDGTPWHSCPTQSLPQAYVQNASLEMAWAYVPKDYGTISGRKILPFFTKGYEGFDINTEADFTEAERLVASGAVSPPLLTAPTV